ncbi:LADA_0H05644g1_1 [Lachancea dasiensis]|uniref:LADA_0H05644g1_1 n=1 Tax=Lachancea dasiensis TaxID=1072105 RepID=A0A1G4K1A3_9SACH|nr:LADA_0H05644g1_1 [Lachancea dasiensis]
MSAHSNVDCIESEAQNIREISKVSSIDNESLREVNQLLESLEHTHRNDLALHLYSTYLLKTQLRAANRKKFALETETYIKTQVKDNWTSWPNPSTVIDPQIGTVYEDTTALSNIDLDKLKPGEISPNALRHASTMVKQELNAVWQQSMAQMASDRGVTLDIDNMTIPNGVATVIMDKMDRFFKGLHTTLASTNKLKLSQTNGSSHLTISELQHNQKPVAMNKKCKLDYRDVLMRGCQMGEDIYGIYMKTLELYGDIPLTYRKEEFKLPKRELMKYASKKRRTDDQQPVPRSKSGYISTEKLLKQNVLSFENRTKLRSILHRHRNHILDQKTFLWVKGPTPDDSEYTPREALSINDWIVPLARNRRRVARKNFRQ